jgi:hypothetical protein
MAGRASSLPEGGQSTRLAERSSLPAGSSSALAETSQKEAWRRTCLIVVPCWMAEGRWVIVEGESTRRGNSRAHFGRAHQHPFAFTLAADVHHHLPNISTTCPLGLIPQPNRVARLGRLQVDELATCPPAYHPPRRSPISLALPMYSVKLAASNDGHLCYLGSASHLCHRDHGSRQVKAVDPARATCRPSVRGEERRPVEGGRGHQRRLDADLQGARHHHK